MKLNSASSIILFFISVCCLAAFTFAAGAAEPKVHVKVLRADELPVKQNGKNMTATMLEVTLDPLAGSPPHRHPGSVSGYIIEGTFEFQVGDGPLQTFRAGDTFFEPAMILHRIGRNPDPEKRTRFIVTMVHPSDARQLVIPEPQ
ncbi:Cupin domain protein [Gimesia maris]|uniref:cupin domain-containing protein n=1 Tax=Gimesia maris TaxID=122 RepID=UPI00118D284E|nr:cupin domain-containing protein [Gimesia maris]QDT78141.1 Cupin domain protein [Gimesia maris]